MREMFPYERALLPLWSEVVLSTFLYKKPLASLLQTRRLFVQVNENKPKVLTHNQDLETKPSPPPPPPPHPPPPLYLCLMSTETFTTTLHSKRIILMSSLLPFLVHQLITGVLPAKGLILRRTWAWRSACMAPWTTIHLRKPLACHLLHLKCSLP